jgi:hypothetical protein
MFSHYVHVLCKLAHNKILRFRVKLEVTDHKSTCVFVVFDSDMSYILEKSCSFFVAQSKVISSLILLLYVNGSICVNNCIFNFIG